MTDMHSLPVTSQSGGFNMFKAMVGIGLACALAIVATYQITLPVITENKAAALEKAIFNVLPDAQTRINFRWNGAHFERSAPNDHSRDIIYAGFNADGRLAGIAIEAHGQGFQDAIQILYGYDPLSQQIIGFQVLESRETPGLGDKIDKDDTFKANFKHLDAALDEQQQKLAHPIITVKHGSKNQPWQIDAITGATISSKAVGNILNQSAQYWAPIIISHLDELKE